jgi:hypothetical protein
MLGTLNFVARDGLYRIRKGRFCAAAEVSFFCVIGIVYNADER